jgi:CubicO group peptidase (beta-lactamase class C family)
LNNKIDISRYAIGYNKEGEAYPIEKYTKASAADNLLTTIEDYSKFMVSIMKGEGLSKAVFEDMIKNQVVTKKGKHFGLGLEIYELDNGEYAISHGGADKGCQTIMFILPKTQQGLVIFTNVDDGYKVYEKILFHYLGEKGRKIFDIETK